MKWLDRLIKRELKKGRSFNQIMSMKSNIDPDVKREVLKKKLKKVKNA